MSLGMCLDTEACGGERCRVRPLGLMFGTFLDGCMHKRHVSCRSHMLLQPGGTFRWSLPMPGKHRPEARQCSL